MNELRSYINSLPQEARDEFARRVGTSIRYLRKAISKGQKIGSGYAVAIERETAGVVRVEQIRPDVDWAVIRGTAIADPQLDVEDATALPEVQQNQPTDYAGAGS